MSTRIVLLDDTFDLATLSQLRTDVYRAALVLFWAAPSTLVAISEAINAPCVCLPELVESDLKWGENAYTLATKVVESGPTYRGLPIRSYLTERLYREAHLVYLGKRAVEVSAQLVVRWRVKSIQMEGVLHSFTEQILKVSVSQYAGLTYTRLAGNRPSDETTSAKKASWLERLQYRVSEVRIVGGWKSQFIDALSGLDRTYAIRCWLGRNLLRGQQPEGTKVVFFSSYANDTRNLLDIQLDMPVSPVWLLTDPSARRDLPLESLSLWLWQFSSTRSTFEGEETFAEPSDDPHLAMWLSISPTWQAWKAVEFSLLANLTACWEEYLAEAQPRLLVTSNQWGIEGWLIQLARLHGIQTLQSMHGVFGGYLFTRTSPLANRVLTWGEFWRDLWPTDDHHRIIVRQSGRRFPHVERELANLAQLRITFFSWPLSTTPAYNASELYGSINQALDELLRMGHMVIIRLHPQEDPSDFIRRWQQSIGPLPDALILTKLEPLEQILAKTDVALMFRSTVMLDCLANRIPVVMPGWIDFGWNDRIAHQPGITLIEDTTSLYHALLVYHHTDMSDGPDDRGGRFLANAGHGDQLLSQYLKQFG